MKNKNNAFISSASIKMPNPNKSFNSKTTSYKVVNKINLGKDPNNLK